MGRVVAVKRSPMPARTKPLAGGGFLRRGKPLRSVSPTNKRWNAPGRARPDEPLADWCQAAIEDVCTGRATDRHHVIPRGPGSSDEAWNTRDLCQPCHMTAHSRPEWAKSVGLLRSRHGAGGAA